MAIEVRFRKTGREIKEAVARRSEELQSRLERRNQVLSEFMQSPQKVRSYMVRSPRNDYGHGGRGGYVLFGPNDISSEEKQEIQQLCTRIFEIEQELHRLALLSTHLDEEQILELSIDDLISYGFSAQGLEGESA